MFKHSVTKTFIKALFTAKKNSKECKLKFETTMENWLNKIQLPFCEPIKEYLITWKAVLDIFLSGEKSKECNSMHGLEQTHTQKQVKVLGFLNILLLISIF